MYKAIHVETGEEIIILNPAWRARIDDLRTLDHADRLVCQGCRQAVRVKAGEHKRPHFAHKHLQACSFGVETPEMLNARAVLYEWLAAQFGEAATLEKAIPGLPHPIDCWVETPTGPAAYWIIEAGIKLEPREAIRAALDGLGGQVQVFFLSTMLREEKKEYHSLLLTPTERAFLQHTPYDDGLVATGETGQTIHYLDAENEQLTTFRGLTLFHRPNWYKGVKKSATLRELRAWRDGMVCYPGEAGRVASLRQKQQRRAEKQKQYQERAVQWERRVEAAQRRAMDDPHPGAGLPARSSLEIRSSASEPEALPCVTCGQITSDYWSTFYDSSGRKLCRCRECLDREA